MLLIAHNRQYKFHVEWLLVLLLLLQITPVQAAREVSAKRECATCHIMWLDEFKREDVKSLIPYEPKPVTRTGKQDVASTERMCFSCHDGFVLDSRFMWKDNKHWHPTGVKPPKDMHIRQVNGKNVFPMNDDGKVYCGSCHSAHGVDWTSKDSTIFLRVKNINSDLCLGCHEQKSSGPKHGNHPVGKIPLEKPSELIEAGGKFAADGGVICQSCHRPHGGKQKAMLVRSNSKAGLCYTCHKNKRGVVDSKHDMTVMAPELKNIYDEDVTEMGPCSACHVPHGGKGPGLWARPIPEGVDKTAAMCTTCHNEQGPAKKKLVGEHSHPLNGDIAKLGITVDAKGWHSKHLWAQGKNNPQTLPLYDKFGQRTTKGGAISCPSCHDPHNWSASVAATDAPPADPKTLEGDRNTSFLRIAQGTDSKLCQNCHVDKRPVVQTSHNMQLLAQTKPKPETKKVAGQNQDKNAEKSAEQAKAMDKDICGFCHAVHNAKGEQLRARETGPGQSPIETWCKDCHQENGLAKDKVIAAHSHPLGKHPQNMNAKSNLPLFDKHGDRAEQDGLVDCATCHNPHQWTPQIPKADTVAKSDKEGDTNSSFLRLTASLDSDLCTTCHQDKALVKGTDHDMRVSAKNARNAQAQAVEQSGICGQCHAVHNPQMQATLWALKPGEGEDRKEQQCRSCHTDFGVASNKIPPASQHPHKVLAWSNATRQLGQSNKLPDTPVFDQEGNQAHAGFISCPSCHNPHQWDPSKAAAGPGKNVEGDVLSSFLRNADSAHIVCADCHGKDALFRYKYYHSKVSRTKAPLYR